jgi:UPF0755 protein
MSDKTKDILIITGIILVLAISGSFFAYDSLFGVPSKNSSAENFVVSQNQTEQNAINNLKTQDFIKSEWGFKYALKKTQIVPGSYKISKNMTAWQLAIAMKTPYMKWIVIPEGLRKEQIAEILASNLGWSDAEKNEWITKDTDTNADYMEGVYFPDSYLIPLNDTPAEVAQIFINQFNGKFQPYLTEALKENEKWTTVLKIASIVQREAGRKSDMPLVAGIIWNRLSSDMALDIDSTIQYIDDDIAHYGVVPTGDQLLNYKSAGSWWSPIKASDTSIKSAYNTYLNKGLPPAPICNPGLDAINAVLNPATTSCLYYLHDSNGQIHCADTLPEQDQNIQEYLK